MQLARCLNLSILLAEIPCQQFWFQQPLGELTSFLIIIRQVDGSDPWTLPLKRHGRQVLADQDQHFAQPGQCYEGHGTDTPEALLDNCRLWLAPIMSACLSPVESLGS